MVFQLDRRQKQTEMLDLLMLPILNECFSVI